MQRTTPSACRGVRHAHATAVSRTSTLHSIVARTLAKASAIALAAALAGPAQAQPTPVQPAAAGHPTAAGALAGPTPSQALVLSPFEVNSSNDVGFVAANSLAGGRMSAPLNDTAAAYSVETREFIDAVHITSLQDAARWGVGTAVELDNGSNETFQTPVVYTIRGVTANEEEKNFFPNLGIYDSYNVDRFDFARGSNAILFGNGSIGGTVNEVTKQADLDQSILELSSEVGSFGLRRNTIDVNRPLIKDKLALRINALSSDKQSWRAGDYERKKGVDATLSWEIAPATELRTDFEYGNDVSMTALTSLNDKFSGWNGTTTFSVPRTTLPSNANNLGVTKLGTGYYVYTPGGTDQNLVNYANTPITQGGGASQGTTGTPVNGVFVVGASPAIDANSIWYALNEDPNRFNTAVAHSAFRVPDPSQTHFPIGQPTMARTSRDGNVAIDHHFGDTLYLEVAADENDQHQDGGLYEQRNWSNVYIDINSVLPNGATNPEFLQPYNEGNLDRNTRDWHTESTRLALAWLHNNRFGKFKVNLMGGTFYQSENTKTFNYQARINPNHQNWSQIDPIYFRYYWNQTATNLTPTGPITLEDPTTGTSTAITPGFVLDNHKNDATDIRYSKFKYLQAAFSAKVLNDHLDLLGAVRRDWSHFSRAETLFPYGYPTDWNGVTPIYAPPAPSDYYTLMYYPKNAAGQITGPLQPADTRPVVSTGGAAQPQYASDRFRSDYTNPDINSDFNTANLGFVYHVVPWFRVLGDIAQTYNTNIALITINGSNIAPSVAHSNDVGVGFTMAEGRLSVNILRYSANENHNAVGAPANMQTDINEFANASPKGTTTALQGNTVGLVDVPSYNDQRQRTSSGFEFEVTANLTAGWRLIANLGTTNASQTNAFPDTRAYLASHDAQFRQALAADGVLVDSNNNATVDQSVPLAQQSPDAQTVANDWNQMQQTKTGLVTGKQPLLGMTRVTSNLFTDYRFQSGVLKNLQVGAGVNYYGRTVANYRSADTMVNPANPTTAILNPADSAYTTIETKPQYLGLATLDYIWKLKQRHALDFSFKVDNVFNNQDVRYYTTTLRPPNGDVTNPARVATLSGYGYNVPRNYYFTVTLQY